MQKKLGSINTTQKKGEHSKSHFTSTSMATKKERETITSIGKDVEKLELLCIAGGNVKW